MVCLAQQPSLKNSYIGFQLRKHDMQYTKLGLYRENARSLSGYFADSMLHSNKTPLNEESGE
jgi:hypothetical protein